MSEKTYSSESWFNAYYHIHTQVYLHIHCLELHNLYFYYTFYFWSYYLSQFKNILLVSKITVLTKNIQPESFGPYLLIFTFCDYILSASENSITIWKTINQPPIDSGKIIVKSKEHSPMYMATNTIPSWHRCKLKSLGRNLKDFWNQYMCYKWSEKHENGTGRHI